MKIKTWQFGIIRIVKNEEITRFDSYIRDDSIGEWSYFQLASGEIVAINNWAED